MSYDEDGKIRRRNNNTNDNVIKFIVLGLFWMKILKHPSFSIEKKCNFDTFQNDFDAISIYYAACTCKYLVEPQTSKQFMNYINWLIDPSVDYWLINLLSY